MADLVRVGAGAGNLLGLRVERQAFRWRALPKVPWKRNSCLNPVWPVAVFSE